MPLQIRYSLRAIDEEIALLTYIQNEFGSSIARKVYREIESILAKIAMMPEMFPASMNQPGLRRCVLSKQTSIYYRVHGDFMEIVSFKDNRMNFDKLQSDT